MKYCIIYKMAFHISTPNGARMNNLYNVSNPTTCADSLVAKIRTNEPFLSLELTPSLSADTSEFVAKIKAALSQTTRNNQNLDSKNKAKSNTDFSTVANTKSSVDSHIVKKAKSSETNNTATQNALSKNLDSKISTHKTLNEKVDAFVCTDSPLARFKPSSILSSIKLQNALSKPLICTLSMRDRNSIALCGEILAANEFDLRAFLTLTGDPIKLGDCIESKAVFEENSLKLGRIIEDLNSGVALNGKSLSALPRKIYNFVVMNSYANNPASLKTKLKRKLLNSEICAFFTQPIFTQKSAEFLLESLDSAKREIIEGDLDIYRASKNANQSPKQQSMGDFTQYCNKNCSQDVPSQSSHNLAQETIQNTQMIFGFFPCLSFKVALFLRDKLPGVFIPQEWLEKLESASAKGKEYEQEVGLTLSHKVWEDLQALHPKIHFMSSNHIEILREFV